jgi:hypothetical protein
MAVLDFESVIADAVAAVFKANGFTAVNALTADDTPIGQRQRPRVEIWFKLTGGYLPIQVAIMPDASERQSAFKAALTVYAISAADAPGKAVHSIFRARVRNLCQTLLGRINGTYLTKHKIHSIVDADTAVSIKTDNDLQQSSLSYSIDFSIHGDAWAAIL